MANDWQSLDDERAGVPRTKTENTGMSRNTVIAIGCGALVVFGAPACGILAAIAIPNFLVMQLRSKRAEGPSTVDKLRAAQLSEHAQTGAFTALAACPEEPSGRQGLVPNCPAWPDVFLGALPETQRCAYSVELLGTDDFRIVAVCDVDGDGDYAIYEASRELRATMISANNVY